MAITEQCWRLAGGTGGLGESRGGKKAASVDKITSVSTEGGGFLEHQALTHHRRQQGLGGASTEEKLAHRLEGCLVGLILPWCPPATL